MTEFKDRQGNTSMKFDVPAPIVQTSMLGNFKPNHTVRFTNPDGTLVGELDFNGQRLGFDGDADESAKVLVEWISHYFDQRLKDERERCAKACEDIMFIYSNPMYESKSPEEITEIAVRQLAATIRELK